VSIDFSKPFYCCTTLELDPLGFKEGNKDQEYFETYREAKSGYEQLKGISGKYAWLAELGVPRDNPKKIDWMYFRTTYKKLWDDLGVEASLRDFQTHGVPEKSSFKSVAFYKSIEHLDINLLKETN